MSSSRRSFLLKSDALCLCEYTIARGPSTSYKVNLTVSRGPSQLGAMQLPLLHKVPLVLHQGVEATRRKA